MKLYIYPGACSRVPLTALEHIGCAYEVEVIDLMKGEHIRPAYQAINPRAKVPALVVDDQLLSENLAILRWLDMRFPEARLFPIPADDWERAQQLSDLAWISSVWHPYVRANKMPIRWTTGDIQPVRERGVELLTPCVKQFAQRLGQSPWWYDDWSILDVYFHWAYTTAEEGHFDLSPFPEIARHRSAVEALPAYLRALDREHRFIPN